MHAVTKRTILSLEPEAGTVSLEAVVDTDPLFEAIDSLEAVLDTDEFLGNIDSSEWILEKDNIVSFEAVLDTDAFFDSFEFWDLVTLSVVLAPDSSDVFDLLETITGNGHKK